MTRYLVVLAALGCKDKLTDKGPVDDTGGDTDVGDDDDDDDDDDDRVTFLAHLVDSPPGPVFAEVGDIDGDGTPDLVVSSLGLVTEANVPPGVVSVYSVGATLDDWTQVDVVPASAGVQYPNHPTLHDIDADGDLDVVVPSGGRLCGVVPAVPACGALRWFSNDGGTWSPRVVIQGSQAFYTSAQIGDLNADGIEDLVTSAEIETPTEHLFRFQLFRASAAGTFGGAPIEVNTGGPFPALDDVDADGDLDVLIGEQASDASFAWYQNTGAAFARHVIAQDLGAGFQIRRVPDLYGDGVDRVVATNHTNTLSTELPDTVESQAVAFEIPADPTQLWTSRDQLSTGIVATPDVPLVPLDAPGTFVAGDGDGDGDLDVIVAGDSDPTVYFLEQVSQGTFETRVLNADVPGSGGTAMADFDADGDLEMVVVSERNDAIYVIERVE